MTDSPLIQITNIGLKFGNRQILNRVSLNIHRREILTIIGPNGAGKSCLLKIILGLYEPTEGFCQRTAGLKIGYMPQRLTIDHNFPLSVERFLSLANQGKPAAIDLALEKVAARTLRQEAIQNLSGGEFQRVLLARALLRQPDVLILDEPAQGVDIQGQQALYHLLASLRDEEGFAILMVSHDLHFVMARTDQVICLNQHVCCSGSAESVSKHPEYLSLFSNTPVADIGVYTHHHDHSHDIYGHVVDEHQSHDHKGCNHD